MPRLVATARTSMNTNGGAPSTPTSHSFSILSSPTSSPSIWPSALQQIVDCEIQPQTIKREAELNSDYLLSPMSSSPAVSKSLYSNSHHNNGQGGVTLACSKTNFSDHEYGQFSTPLTPSSSSHTPSSSSAYRRVYMTPSSVMGSSSSGRRTTSAYVMTSSVPSPASGSHLKTEARRRLNLDTAPVDREGFKTPIKATKRKQDLSSSPSPKKSKFKYHLNQGSQTRGPHVARMM